MQQLEFNSGDATQDAFLRSLAYDDNFRSALTADPAGTLARYGIEVDSAAMPQNVSLPGKDQVASALSLEEDIATHWFPFLTTAS